jgi:Fe-S-cluster containining protein
MSDGPGPSSTDRDLASAWLASVRTEAVLGALQSVFVRVEGEIASRQPICTTSGRCCHFEQFDHRLYTTGLETAYTIARLETPLTQDALDAAINRGGCPFQSDVLCNVHTIRPVGCRVYFCDPTAQQWMEDLAERAHNWVRAIHTEHNIAYRYGEWRSMLAMFIESLSTESQA